MSGAQDPSSLDALTAVQRLENALEQRDGARDVAEDAMATARAEAEAAAIRADGSARADEVRRRASAERDELIAELTELLLQVEA